MIADPGSNRRDVEKLYKELVKHLEKAVGRRRWDEVPLSFTAVQRSPSKKRMRKSKSKPLLQGSPAVPLSPSPASRSEQRPRSRSRSRPRSAVSRKSKKRKTKRRKRRQFAFEGEDGERGEQHNDDGDDDDYDDDDDDGSNVVKTELRVLQTPGGAGSLHSPETPVLALR